MIPLELCRDLFLRDQMYVSSFLLIRSGGLGYFISPSCISSLLSILLCWLGYDEENDEQSRYELSSPGWSGLYDVTSP